MNDNQDTHGERNPWKRNASREVYRNPWIAVREDAVITPAGRPGIYGVVEARAATGVVAITGNQEVYLVGQYRYPVDLYSWEIVEGGAHEEELPRTAIERELREEAGVTARSWSELGTPLHLSNCFSNEVAHLFLAWGLTEGVKAPDDTEQLVVKKVPLEECFSMLHRGEFTDAMTIIALHRVEQMVVKGIRPWM